ncbi:MAG: 4Fe-4S dicluster domain-containing protein [Deferribacterales bacterium]|jgi:molybdopterin-containing oxidoreductase family iron-sulfur binding subunit
MNESNILRMQRDLERALLKPEKNRKWAMLIDIRKCTGCHACSVSCKAENKTPEGVNYRWVKETEDGTFPNVQRYFMPGMCMQCDDAPCIKACTSGAIIKRADGIVAIDYSKCVGCGGNAVAACPYGAVSLDKGDFYTDKAYENGPVYEYGNKYKRDKDTLPVNSCRKCHYCLHRLTAGMLPTCATTCLGGATYFGDINDPESLIAQKAKELDVYVYMQNEKTVPTTKYITDSVELCKKCHG